MLIRLEALELFANAGSADDSDRYGLHMLQVRPDGSVVVTDGTALLRIHAAVEEPGLFDALLPAEERGYEGEVLIDATDARDFKAACKKALKRAGRKSVADGGEPVHVVVARIDDGLTLGTADGIVERRFVIKQDSDLKYPDVDRVMPTDTTRHILVSVDLLLKMLKTLKRLRVPSVRLGLTDRANRPITIEADSLAGKIDGCLMPMRDEEHKEEPLETVDTSTGEIAPVHASV